MGLNIIRTDSVRDLMFDDGRPADERSPRGVTGWIKDVSEL